MSDKWVLVPVEPTPEMLEPMAREDCKHDGFDPDEPMPPHGQYPRWYDRCGPFAEIYLAMLAARPAAPAQDFNAGIEAAAKLLDKAHDEWLGWADGAPPEGLEHYVTLAGYAEGYAASIRELKNPTGEILSGFECSQCRGIWRRGQPESHEDGCPLAIRALKREG